MKLPDFIAADLFCGAGGTSTGMVRAANRIGLSLDLVAVNHWPTAVETHRMNHPWARHLCADLASVEANPERLVPGRRLDLLVASPECTHHSVARGGKPCSDQSRSSAWHVLHWLELLDVEDVLIENVREFADWGPLLKRGTMYKGKWHAASRPDPRRKGATFAAFVGGIRSFGYQVEWRVINAADYGAATTRRRLFLRASKRKGPVAWPAPSHAAEADAGHLRWKSAREIIDWGLKGESIFGRRVPLKPKTLARIEAGLKKFGGEAFIAVLRGTAAGQAGSWSASVDAPLKTISAGGIHAALCQPFVVNVAHAGGERVSGCDAPLGTIPAGHRGEFGLVEPFIVQYQGGEDAKALRVHSVDNPLPTQPTENRFGLCQPFVVQTSHTGTTGRAPYVKSVDDPLTTVTGRVEHGVCVPFLTKYYGSGAGARPVTDPLDTVTTKDRFALVQPRGMDILFRMLQPHELAAAMGFDGYAFTGNKTEQVRQIGNAVSVPPAEALCHSIMARKGGPA